MEGALDGTFEGTRLRDKVGKDDGVLVGDGVGDNTC